nr:MAG: ORF1 [TTV-like mini virus]
MPWNYKRNYRWRTRPFRWRKRRYFRRRRTRNTFRPIRRYRRRHWVRKRRFYKTKRKAKKLRLYQWQPSTIVKCKIKGIMQLLNCSKGRESNNYAQYQDSITPEHWPGGGGFSYLIFTLSALWEEHEKLHNWWTKSNKYLDLTRYQGVRFKFYRQPTVDYVVVYQRCYPMVDGKYSHASCQPQRLLLRKHKIIVGSKLTNPHKKPYVTKFIKPPQQLINKWFFTKELANTGLVLLSVASTTLQSMFIDTNSQSTTIQFTVLNPKVFHNCDWQKGTGNQYRPNENYWYYGTVNGVSETGKPKHNQLIDLQGTTNTQGEENPLNTGPKRGNLLFHNYIHETSRVWVTQNQINQNNDSQALNVAPLSQPLLQKCRYNPNKDTGYDNIAYILQNDRSKFNEIPESNLLKIDGFPLWLLLFGWKDWLEKIKPGAQIERNYTLVFQSKFVTPQLPYYVLIDESFVDNKGPWDTPTTLSDDTHWYPQIRYQLQSINNICTSGPAMPRPLQKSWEAKAEYTFFFKWGGCPANHQDLENPDDKPTYTVPDKQLFRNEIEDPETPPQIQIHDFDFRRDYITEKSLKRIQEYSDPSTTLFTDGEIPRKRLRPTLDPEPTIPPTKTTLQEILPTPENQEEEKTIQLLQQQQQLLRHRIQLLNQLKVRKFKTSI